MRPSNVIELLTTLFTLKADLIRQQYVRIQSHDEANDAAEHPGNCIGNPSVRRNVRLPTLKMIRRIAGYLEDE